MSFNRFTQTKFRVRQSIHRRRIMTSMIDLQKYNPWLGKEESAAALIDVGMANKMNAALDREPTFARGDALPPAWHWLYFHRAVRAEDLAADGHPKLGGFMPPISFGDGAPPRRMWAGGKLTFEHPIRLGDRATKHSIIKSITPKEGRSGALCFVSIENEISVDGHRCLCEEQTIVYRQPSQSNGEHLQNASAKPAATDADFSKSFTPDPVLLFRYSALTFNSHRIHYDVDYCRQQEGYPNLVVHGPLTATLLLDLFYRQFPDRQIATFDYRGLSPLFNPHAFTLNGKESGEAWAANHQGRLAMSATVMWK